MRSRPGLFWRVKADYGRARREFSVLGQIQFRGGLEHLGVLGGDPAVSRLVAKVAAEALLAVLRVLGRVQDVKMPQVVRIPADRRDRRAVLVAEPQEIPIPPVRRLDAGTPPVVKHPCLLVDLGAGKIGDRLSGLLGGALSGWYG